MSEHAAVRHRRNGFREVTLGALVEEAGGFIRTGPFGSQLHQSDYTDDPAGFPVIMPKDMVNGRVDRQSVSRVDAAIVDRLAAHRLTEGDIVLARRGDVGRFAFIESDEEGWLCGTGSMRVHAPNRAVVEPRFLRYALSHPGVTDWFVGQAVGATMPNLNASIVSALPLVAPESGTQRRIGSTLAAFDELIEINERRIEVLEDLARSLYREWFVRFRFPGYDNVDLVDSELGPIPEGWEVARLDRIARVLMGQSPKSEFYNETGDGLPFHQGVSDYGRLIPTHRKFTTVGPRVAEHLDVLCSVRAPVGRLNLADRRLVVGRGVAAIRRHDGRTALLSEQLRQALGEVDSIGGGTIFKAIGKDELTGLQILEPPESLRYRFEEVAGPMLHEQIQLTLQTRALASTRDLLLPRLVTGQLDISDIDLGVLTPQEAA